MSKNSAGWARGKPPASLAGEQGFDSLPRNQIYFRGYLMKGNTKRVKAAEPAPVDSIDVIDRTEFEGKTNAIYEQMYRIEDDVRDYFENKIKLLTHQNEMIIAVGSVVAAAICFVIAMRRER